MPSLKQAIDGPESIPSHPMYDDVMVATEYYPDDTIIPHDDIPVSWLEMVLTFYCHCGYTTIGHLDRLLVNMDYFEPEKICSHCKEYAYIKKWV
jgi:hypothetical protein